MEILHIFSTSEAANLATVIAAMVAAVSLAALAYQARLSRQIANGKFLLQLEEVLKRHDRIRLQFAPRGAWREPGSGPKTTEECEDLNDYMGFFEHCEILISSGALNEQHFFRLFGFLLADMSKNNALIDAKISDEGVEYWSDFRKVQTRWRKYSKGFKN